MKNASIQLKGAGLSRATQLATCRGELRLTIRMNPAP